MPQKNRVQIVSLGLKYVPLVNIDIGRAGFSSWIPGSGFSMILPTPLLLCGIGMSKGRSITGGRIRHRYGPAPETLAPPGGGSMRRASAKRTGLRFSKRREKEASSAAWARVWRRTEDGARYKAVEDVVEDVMVRDDWRDVMGVYVWVK